MIKDLHPRIIKVDLHLVVPPIRVFGGAGVQEQDKVTRRERLLKGFPTIALGPLLQFMNQLSQSRGFDKNSCEAEESQSQSL